MAPLAVPNAANDRARPKPWERPKGRMNGVDRPKGVTGPLTIGPRAIGPGMKGLPVTGPRTIGPLNARPLSTGLLTKIGERYPNPNPKLNCGPMMNLELG